MRWFAPAALIILGLVLLLENLGLLPPIAWRSLGLLWPVVLVGLGLDLIITGRISWAGFFGALVALLILAIVAGALGFPTGLRDRAASAGYTATRLQNPEAAHVYVDQ